MFESKILYTADSPVSHGMALIFYSKIAKSKKKYWTDHYQISHDQPTDHKLPDNFIRIFSDILETIRNIHTYMDFYIYEDWT